MRGGGRNRHRYDSDPEQAGQRPAETDDVSCSAVRGGHYGRTGGGVLVRLDQYLDSRRALDALGGQKGGESLTFFPYSL